MRTSIYYGILYKIIMLNDMSNNMTDYPENMVQPQLQLIYPIVTPSNVQPNILLIDNTVQSYQTFVDSVNSTTFPIVYSKDCSQYELLSLLRNNFITINRIGFCFTSAGNHSSIFLDNEPFFDISYGIPSGISVKFMLDIIREFSVKNVDFLACNTLNYANWVNYYNLLKQSTGITVGASDNKTGNLKYGGDWVFESTSQDIESVYFTKSIEYYQYLLDNLSWVSTIPNILTLTSDGTYIYTAGDNNKLRRVSIATGIVDSSWTTSGSIGTHNGSTNGFYNTYGIAAYKGNIYLANRGFAGRITRINILNQNTDIVTDWFTYNNAVYSSPTDCRIHKDFLYVCVDNNILRFSLTVGKTSTFTVFATSTQGIGVGPSITFDDSYMYASSYNNSTISRISLTNPTQTFTTNFCTGVQYIVSSLVHSNGYLYMSQQYAPVRYARINLSNLSDANYSIAPTVTGVYVRGGVAEGYNVYMGYNSGILQFDVPFPQVQPSSNFTIDTGNTKTVSSGNLQVSIIDLSNVSVNNVYYLYSTTGDNNANYINSGVITNGPNNTIFYIPNLLSDISYTIFVKASNTVGNSSPINQQVIVYQTPRQPTSYSVSSSTSGNINVSVTETSPLANYNLNDVAYWYYVYTTGTNQSANINAYSLGTSMNSSYNTNFVIQNLPTNNYRVYLLARNTVGNSTPFLSTSANVTVFSTPSSPNSYSLSFDELTGITVSITDTRNVAQNQVYYHYYYYRIGDTAPNQSADINVYANSYVPVVNGQTSYSFNIKGLQTSYYNVYIAAKNSVGGNIYTPVIEPVNVICFKEDSRILTNRGYRKIQYLKRGDLVKTFKDGFKPIYKIGKKEIMHVPSLEERTKDQLYKCSPTEYPELFEDLVLTGCHSILVDEFVDDEQRTQTRQINGGIYVTDKKYRLPVCVDKRASVYEKEGKYSVYHIALENNDYYMNYGIYANGLLVESTSKRFLDEYKVMETQNIHTNTKTIATTYSNLLIHQQKYNV